MKHKIRNVLAATAIAAASVVAVPAAANATIYPPANACSVVSNVVTPGASVTFNCESGTFTPGEFVTVVVEGENGAAAQIGFAKFAISTATGTVTASSTGSSSASVTLPSDATGVYNLSAFSETSAGGSASVSIGSTAGGGSTDDGLATTGLDSTTTLGLWVGGGALVLAGSALAVGAGIRRNRAKAGV